MQNSDKNQSIKQDFTMDPNLLVSVIKSQAGSLSKAILEGIMNSIDANASRIDVTLSQTEFAITDNGKGFTNAEEVSLWFGRFGTPHVENDAIYGRFRMGRGQMMSFAEMTWLSNEFCMHVDIEKNGLTYNLKTCDAMQPGCHVKGVLYKSLSNYEFKDTLTELKKFIAYTPKPVYVNGELYGASPARLKSWTFENDDAYFKVTQDCEEIEIYNQGVFVQSMGSWRTGMGGIIVSKKPLEVNFARNSILENKCQIWKSIQITTDAIVVKKLMDAKKLTDGERKFLARRVMGANQSFSKEIIKAKIITDPSGKHSSLDSLKNFTKFVYIAETGPLACSVHGNNETFVVTDKLLNRFGYYNIEEFMISMREHIGLIHDDAIVIDENSVSSLGLGKTKMVDSSALTSKFGASFATLQWLNCEISKRLTYAGYNANERQLLIGTHKRNTFVAWTDGKSYVTVNKSFLKRLESGMNGAWFWIHSCKFHRKYSK